MLRKIYIRNYEYGLHFRDGEFVDLYPPGTHWLFDPMLRHAVSVVSQRDVWLSHLKLDMIVRAGVLDCLLYTSPSPRDKRQSRMPSSA